MDVHSAFYSSFRTAHDGHAHINMHSSCQSWSKYDLIRLYLLREGREVRGHVTNGICFELCAIRVTVTSDSKPQNLLAGPNQLFLGTPWSRSMDWWQQLKHDPNARLLGCPSCPQQRNSCNGNCQSPGSSSRAAKHAWLLISSKGLRTTCIWEKCREICHGDLIPKISARPGTGPRLKAVLHTSTVAATAALRLASVACKHL